VTVLADVAAAADPSLAQYAVEDPGAGRFEAVVEDRDRAFVLEAVYEGYLLHYGSPRAFRGMDADLRLLAGDTLYALGLARLAERGDIAAVSELADLISLSAWAEAEGRRSLVPELWDATVSALSPGGGPGVRAAVGDRLR
jgi:hypothetical protein